MNEELRTKNEELGGKAAYALAGESENFMPNHKGTGNTCETR